MATSAETNRLAGALSPADRQDEFTHWLRDEAGYLAAKRLDDGTYVALSRLMFTLGLCFNCGPIAWERRYCFEDASQAIAEFEAATTNDYQPTGWVDKRPKHAD